MAPVWLLLTWLVVNLLQAALTPLDADETYYWMYAGRLAWGYFDHPPAVAVLIGLGKDWLPGALGLRFGHVLAGTATVAALWHLLGKPTGRLLWLAAALIAAQPFLNVYGFIATPDGPLLLFSVLYLLAYRRFLDGPTVGRGAVWGLTMAGLLYSKYHGLMLIFFTVLPHLGFLLRQPGAWVAALGGAALYAPHLYWQYANDYPSFRYHLSGRDDVYELKYTVEYVLNQLVIFSPLLVYHYVRTFRRDDSRGDRFARACRWLVIGFLLFFLYTTTKGGTEAQWTALLSIPLVYLTFRAARDRFPEWQPLLFRLATITVALLTVARLLLMAPRDLLPFKKPFDHQPWTEELATIADDLPLLVQNSYRIASVYEFYTGRPAWTFTDVEYRRNQYDLWTADSVFHGRPALVLGQVTWTDSTTKPFRTQTRDMKYRRVEDFQVIKGTELTYPVTLPDTVAVDGRYPLRVVARPPRRVGLHRDLTIDLHATLYYADGSMAIIRLKPLATGRLEADRESVVYEGTLKIPAEAVVGEASYEIGLGYAGMPPLRGDTRGILIR